ncbi:class I SAM-dependent methyltransferase [Natronolimnohabitans innermongolicus]|uniref:Methyltransferase domain-containing protein n=1 Tax=Natronolimnohabitans innermongolicus JCM 12255 TaxID=1227499 RepID=L9WRX8_9EURY|nr:class I SAM-dependent methyltransferase [Natronolimnohabitans innermongolicus]ELY52230.1 hypothetical protein C493_16319 [Natronolimnohabitans innermongolicus JCM 12255]
MNYTDVRRHWAERSGEYSPEYYAYYGPNEASEAVRDIVEQSLDRSASVLELGCSSGRHLSHLREHGFDDLTGIELNEDAIDVMAETYPDLATAGEFHVAPIEDVVTEFDDDAFDAVYSVETLQHLHPDVDWVYDELARITSDLLVTVENEEPSENATASEDGDASDADPAGPNGSNVSYVNGDFPLYHRDWNAIFTERGFVEIDVRSTKRDTVRAFRPASERPDR